LFDGFSSREVVPASLENAIWRCYNPGTKIRMEGLMNDRTEFHRPAKALVRPARGLAGLVLAAVLAGCSSSSSLSSSSLSDLFGSSSSSPSSAAPAADAAAAAQAAQATPEFDCPSVEIRSGASTLLVTATPRGGEASANDLRYQGSIGRTARECRLNAGIVSLRVGIEGRIIVGPAGGQGQVDVPMRVAVVEEGPNPKTVATKLYRTMVAVPADDGNVNFSIVAEDLSFPMPRGNAIDRYVIYIGFDPQAEPVRQQRRPARRSAG
jgi:hypothetical protein